MRLGFAVAAHLEVDVLLLDEVFAVGDEEFQRQVLRQDLRVQAARRDDRLRPHAAAVESGLRARDPPPVRPGRVRRLDPGGHFRARAGGRGAAYLRERGTGDARIADVRLLGPDGDDRLQLAAGESLAVVLRVVATRQLPPPRLTLEPAASRARPRRRRGRPRRARLGRRTELAVRHELARTPFADGRFHVRAGLQGADGATVLHQLDDALAFVVPGGRGAGPRPARRLVGMRGDRRPRRTLRSMTTRTCPDWPRLMEIAPDLQFKHYTVAEAHLPHGGARPRGRGVARLDRDLLRPRAPRVLCRAHRSPGRRALRGTHWFGLEEWASTAPARPRSATAASTTPWKNAPVGGARP